MAPFLSVLLTEVSLVYRVRVSILVVVALLLAACQPLPALPTVAPIAIQPSAEATQSSPIATPASAASPSAPSQPSVAAGERFLIDRPVKAGDTVVKGNGPKGMPIVLYDLTRMGVELGSTTIGEDGRFTIKVEPLTGNTRIGIQPADYNEAIWADKTLLGPGAQAMPMVGAFVDTVLVSP